MKNSASKIAHISSLQLSRRAIQPSVCAVIQARPQMATQLLCQQKRFVSIKEDSWAASQLSAKGEKLDPIDNMDVKVITDDDIKNPTERIKKLINIVLSLNVVEMHQLTTGLKSRMGVTDEMLYGKFIGRAGGGIVSAGGGDAGAAAAAAPPAAEKTTFDLKLGAVDAKAKIKIIKEVRTITGLGLKEAKDLVEKAPVVIKEGIKKEEAEQMKKLIVEAGGVVELL